MIPDGTTRLLAGPPLDGKAESLEGHRARLGPLELAARGDDLITALEATGLLGRGGAGFPVGRKWRAMADRGTRHAVIVANGAEGEPASAKDRVLMTHRPHLILDGAILAADAVGADEIVVYVGGEHDSSVEAMRRALDERTPGRSPRVRLVTAPMGYVAGEASAAVHYIDGADPRPTTTPPRMSERGVGGRPTLVQNVESLAYAALIARFGAAWYREMGRAGCRGTALLTVTGAVDEQGVREVELGTPVGEVVEMAGGSCQGIGAIILGGYFGTWARVEDAWALPLDPAIMRDRGLSFGCGIVGLLPVGACGVAATAEVMSFMARESAAQCGPCLYGLRAIADAMARVAACAARPADLEDLARWTGLVTGRGACGHPDGAAQLMASALEVFRDDLAVHAEAGHCALARERRDVA